MGTHARTTDFYIVIVDRRGRQQVDFYLSSAFDFLLKLKVLRIWIDLVAHGSDGIAQRLDFFSSDDNFAAQNQIEVSRRARYPALGIVGRSAPFDAGFPQIQPHSTAHDEINVVVGQPFCQVDQLFFEKVQAHDSRWRKGRRMILRISSAISRSRFPP